MAEDPAFLFYPGDYLRDTQNLSEKAQVAYDRIMCEHMRNICEDMIDICITYKQHKFFTKRLNDDEKEELEMVLIKTSNGFQIRWVAESISKRKSYSDSRRSNREGKKKEHMINICKSYVPHMENENVVIYNKECELFLNDQIWLEQVCKRFSLNPNPCKTEMKQFTDKLRLQQDFKNLKELRSHFINLIDKRQRERKPDYTTVNKNPTGVEPN